MPFFPILNVRNHRRIHFEDLYRIIKDKYAKIGTYSITRNWQIVDKSYVPHINCNVHITIVNFHTEPPIRCHWALFWYIFTLNELKTPLKPRKHLQIYIICVRRGCSIRKFAILMCILWWLRGLFHFQATNRCWDKATQKNFLYNYPLNPIQIFKVNATMVPDI